MARNELQTAVGCVTLGLASDFHTYVHPLSPNLHQRSPQHFQIFLSHSGSYHVDGVIWPKPPQPLSSPSSRAFGMLPPSLRSGGLIITRSCMIVGRIKPPGTHKCKPRLCLPSYSSLMARGQGSITAPVAQTERRSTCSNFGSNGRDVQLDRLGEQLVAPTRQKKRAFVAEDGLTLEDNPLAPVLKKKRCSKVFTFPTLTTLSFTHN
jgi:hypothetical protein